jgi:translation initiation factor 2 subunit 2
MDKQEPENLYDNDDNIEEDFSRLLLTKKKKKKVNNFTENIPIFESDNVVNNVFKFNYDYMLETVLSNFDNKILKNKITIPHPVVNRVGPKKVLWNNFASFPDILKRPATHIINYFKVECCTELNTDSNNALIIRGVFNSTQIENILKKYIIEYVKCNTCSAIDTSFTKDPITRIYYINCNNCLSKRSSSIISEGFIATTRKDRIKNK